MDKIFVKGLKVFAYHGVNQDEKINGQNFVLDIEMGADLSKARESDSLDETVNYAKVAKLSCQVMTEKSYDLIEKAATEVAKSILERFGLVKYVRVKLKKPEAPIKLDFDYVAVEVFKERSDVNA